MLARLAAALAGLTLIGAAPAPPAQNRTAALERAILAEINFARTRPRDYADTLRAYRRHFRGKIVYYPEMPHGLRTAEGVKAVDEAIRFLEDQPPIDPVAPSALLARAARDHVIEQGPRGATGHLSKDGANPRDRAKRRGAGIYVAEVITYGPPSAVEVVRQLIVDDDVPARGHRRTVFATEMRFMGAACGPHKVYRIMCVAEFARNADGRP